MSNQFPSSYSGEISPVSSVDKRPKRKAVQKKQDEDESIFDEDDEAEKKVKKNKRALGIQNKVITKPKPLDSKFKKLANASQPQVTFLYKPGVLLPYLNQFVNQVIELRIGTEYIVRENIALIQRQVWGGNGVYSSNSDCVAMGVHHGFLNLDDPKLELYQGVSLFCKVVKGKRSLPSSYKQPILSRALKQQCSHCLKPERVQWLNSLGSKEQLVSWASKMIIPENKRLTKQNYLNIYGCDNQQTNQFDNFLIKNIPPLNEGWIIWDMCNEPSQKYNVINFMDRQTNQGYKTNTSYKLKSHVLFIENLTDKYQIYMEEDLREEDVFLEQSMYILGKVPNPKNVDIEYLKQNGLPVQDEIVMKSLKWDDFIWGQDYVKVKNELTIRDLRCFKLVPLKIINKSN